MKKLWTVTQQWHDRYQLPLYLIAALYIVLLPLVLFVKTTLVTELILLTLATCPLTWIFISLVRFKRLMSIVLIAAILSLPITARESPPLHADAGGPQVVGAIVLGGGVIIVIILIKICKRVFPEPPAPPPPETNGIPGLAASVVAGDSDAASYLNERVYGFCYVDSDLVQVDLGPLEASAFVSNPQTLVQLDLTIEPTADGLSARLKPSSKPASTRFVDIDEFKAGIAKWGLNFDERVTGSSYAKNGQPVPQLESAIQFPINERGQTIPTITKNGKSHQAVLDQSDDLIHWSYLVRLNIEEGQTIRIVDTSSANSRFYRIRTVQSN